VEAANREGHGNEMACMRYLGLPGEGAMDLALAHIFATAFPSDSKKSTLGTFFHTDVGERIASHRTPRVQRAI
jgi:hypothetical protein